MAAPNGDFGDSITSTEISSDAALLTSKLGRTHWILALEVSRLTCDHHELWTERLKNESSNLEMDASRIHDERWILVKIDQMIILGQLAGCESRSPDLASRS